MDDKDIPGQSPPLVGGLASLANASARPRISIFEPIIEGYKKAMLEKQVEEIQIQYRQSDIRLFQFANAVSKRQDALIETIHELINDVGELKKNSEGYSLLEGNMTIITERLADLDSRLALSQPDFNAARESLSQIININVAPSTPTPIPDQKSDKQNLWRFLLRGLSYGAKQIVDHLAIIIATGIAAFFAGWAGVTMGQ